MKNLKTSAPVLLFMLFLSACNSSDDDSGTSIQAVSLFTEGVNISLRNTLQEGGPEAAFPTLFGLSEEAYDENSTLSFTVSEFPTALAQPGSPAGDISGLYNIDINENSISFTLLPAADDPFWSGVFSVFPAGKFDRYYFTFSEPHNITRSTSSNSSVSLRLDSPTVAVVEISEGYDMNPGTAFSINVE